MRTQSILVAVTLVLSFIPFSPASAEDAARVRRRLIAAEIRQRIGKENSAHLRQIDALSLQLGDITKRWDKLVGTQKDLLESQTDQVDAWVEKVEQKLMDIEDRRSQARTTFDSNAGTLNNQMLDVTSDSSLDFDQRKAKIETLELELKNLEDEFRNKDAGFEDEKTQILRDAQIGFERLLDAQAKEVLNCRKECRAELESLVKDIDALPAKVEGSFSEGERVYLGAIQGAAKAMSRLHGLEPDEIGSNLSKLNAARPVSRKVSLSARTRERLSTPLSEVGATIQISIYEIGSAGRERLFENGDPGYKEITDSIKSVLENKGRADEWTFHTDGTKVFKSTKVRLVFQVDDQAFDPEIDRFINQIFQLRLIERIYDRGYDIIAQDNDEPFYWDVYERESGWYLRDLAAREPGKIPDLTRYIHQVERLFDHRSDGELPQMDASGNLLLKGYKPQLVVWHDSEGKKPLNANELKQFNLKLLAERNKLASPRRYVPQSAIDFLEQEGTTTRNGGKLIPLPPPPAPLKNGTEP